MKTLFCDTSNYSASSLNKLLPSFHTLARSLRTHNCARDLSRTFTNAREYRWNFTSPKYLMTLHIWRKPDEIRARTSLGYSCTIFHPVLPWFHTSSHLFPSAPARWPRFPSSSPLRAPLDAMSLLPRCTSLWRHRPPARHWAPSPLWHCRMNIDD